MSLHSFDPDVAANVGVNAAVLYQNIVFWTRKNAANGRNVRDGKVWTYNSVQAWSTLFPYLSRAQIRTALAKLEEAGLVYVGNYNETAYDRTKWYGVSMQMHLSKNANGFAQNDEPIPDSKPYQKPDSKLSKDVVSVFDAYNETAERVGWPMVQSKSMAREQAAAKRMKECGGFKNWRQAIERAAASDFLSGKATGTTPASFDWIHKPANFTKIMEGNYDNKRTATQRRAPEGQPHRPDPALEQIARLAGLGQASGDGGA